MQKCKDCGKSHSNDYHLAKRLTSKGYPRSDTNYPTAHKEASKKEKEKFPKKDYERLKHLDETGKKNTLIGKNDEKGKIDVSKAVPKSLRKEVAFHEKIESQILRNDKSKRPQR